VSPRQRRGILLLLLAMVSAAVVFVLVLSYVAEVESRVGSVTQALRLRGDVQPHTRVTPSMVEVVEVPERWLPDTVLRSPAELRNRVAASLLRAGSYVQQDMLEEPPVLRPDERELAITIDAETGVAGKIRPGDLVDIYATFEGGETAPPSARLVVANVRVVEVGRLAQTEDTRLEGRRRTVVPITFALTNEEALILSHAESFATNVRLSLLAPGQRSRVPPPERVFPPVALRVPR
jgi:pilus assembly protein CpaB